MDKVAIGLTAPNDQFVGQLMESGLFGQEMEAAKLAMSIAIVKKSSLGDVQGAGTKWNVGSFDRDGQLKRLMGVLYPTVDEPYRVMEFLINTGLKIMADACRNASNIDVRRLLALAESARDLSAPRA
ncbi:MAG: hypothetical protein AB7U95_23390 [Reyranella sp.]